jgi:HEPN domain
MPGTRREKRRHERPQYRADAGEPALRRQNPLRRRVPLAGGARQKALPHARRRGAIRRTKGKQQRAQARAVHGGRDRRATADRGIAERSAQVTKSDRMTRFRKDWPPTPPKEGGIPRDKLAPNPTKQVVVFYPPVTPNREAELERINPFSFYNFGKELHLLEEVSDTSTRKVFYPLWQAQGSMQRLLGGDPLPLGISSGKARELKDRIDNLMAQRFSTKNEKDETILQFPEDADEPISGWAHDWIKTGIKDFETVFAEEMRETATYFVPRRGIYHTPALVDAADATFPAALQSVIPQKAKDDWRAAGRCLAFNLLSASGFHVARAVEACLEAYYQLFSGKPGETLHGWKAYIDALEKIAQGHPTPCPLKKTLIELDQMREDYRNPIVHPRVVLTEGDARMLFANGESVIIAMAQELAEVAKGVQPSLALVGGSDIRAIEGPKGHEAEKFTGRPPP